MLDACKVPLHRMQRIVALLKPPQFRTDRIGLPRGRSLPKLFSGVALGEFGVTEVSHCLVGMNTLAALQYWVFCFLLRLRC